MVAFSDNHVAVLFGTCHTGLVPATANFQKAGVSRKWEIEKERYALKYLRGDFDPLFTRQVLTPAEIYSAIAKSRSSIF